MSTQDMDSSLDYRREIERSGPVSLQTKLFYASGELPGAYMNLAIGGFLLLYYNQILGASPAAVSAALGIWVLFYALYAPVVGALCDTV